MAHELGTNRDGKSSFAFTGSRDDIWHRLGQQMAPGMGIDAWAAAAGLDFHVHKVKALAALDLPGMDARIADVPDRFFLARGDNGHVFDACVSGMYQPVQPRDVLAWFNDYICVDERFHVEAAGALRQGDTIWASARFNGDLDVGGDKHTARLLMSTTFDCSGATINKPVMTRTVCANTLGAALAEPQSAVKTRHNTKFNPRAVADELGRVASGFAKFKVMGDALAQASMARGEVSTFFKELLDIPFDAKQEDVSTRKQNQFADLSRAYTQSVREVNGLNDNTAWMALNAVTRYVDHSRSVRGTDQYAQGEAEARFASAQFGSGQALKAQAWNLLLPRIKDKVPVAA